MAKESKLKDDLKADPRFKKELLKLKNLFKNIPKDKQTLTAKLTENAAFMAILLDDLRADIDKEGYYDTYQNGENQHGKKRSIAADLYTVTIKNYASIIRQLTDLLPKSSIEDNDGFDDFINSRDDA